MQHEMRVILGSSSIKAYVTAPKSHQVIGIVRFGQEYGLLATDAQGTFFRVNGSQIVELDTQQVNRAVQDAHEAGIRNFAKFSSGNVAARVVPVSIRRHRHYVCQS